jgi:UDP-3-O-[3-hydroxymyristoyl] N-acetylglucosamine deacetylase
MLAQRTIKNSVSARGITLHSGVVSNITLKPAETNTGIVFRRVDLDNKEIQAHNDNVSEVVLCTSLQNQDVKIATVEHILSALSSLGIDNLIVEIDSDEIPIMDGSASPFMFLIEAAGVLEQDAYKKFFVIKKEISVEKNGAWAKLKPYEGFKITVEIDFEHKVIKNSGQKLSLDFSKESYLKEISRARTFGHMSDVEALQSNNLALGASVDNAIALDKDSLVQGQTLRYKNEFIKHKILDVVGDLYLLGGSLIGEYEGYRTGHALNDMLLNALLKDKDAFEVKTFEMDNAPISFYSQNLQQDIV